MTYYNTLYTRNTEPILSLLDCIIYRPVQLLEKLISNILQFFHES